MIRQRLSHQLITIGSILAFALGCNSLSSFIATPTPAPTPTPIPISQKASGKILEEWGFLQLINTFGTVSYDMSSGKVVDIKGDIELDFAFENHPIMILEENNGQKYFKFDSPMPYGGSTPAVIFVTADVEGAQVKIPRFTTIPVKSEDSTSVCKSVKKFTQYAGEYNFKICITFRGSATWIVDMNIFHDGAEHYILGNVELFGVKFENTSKEPLVFKINGDKYLYVKGVGTATTQDGTVIQFGK